MNVDSDMSLKGQHKGDCINSDWKQERERERERERDLTRREAIDWSASHLCIRRIIT